MTHEFVRNSNEEIRVSLDRLQLVSRAAQGRRPPPVEGFAVTRDSFVRCQTTTSTYARCRQFKSLTNDTKIYWQYDPQKAWLKPWKITIVADDRTGLSRGEIEQVLRHCQSYKLLTLEVAIDFSRSTGVNRQFIRRHGLFGKSRRHRAEKGENRGRYGGRKSAKLVRCYEKDELAVFRVELELHSRLLRSNGISTIEDFRYVRDVICPWHLQFASFDWDRLKSYLTRKNGQSGPALVAAAQKRTSSMRRVRRYLTRHQVLNLHRFLAPLAVNKEVVRSLDRWVCDFQEESHG